MANHDILKTDSTIYLAGSDPVPVVPEPEPEPLYRDNATITLGSGTLYLTEYDGETLPDVESVCVEENRMGYTKGGAALQYTEETTEERDDLGYVSKIITTKTDVVLKCGLITWNGETLLKLIDRCTTVIQDGKRVVKIGGRGNAKGAKYVIVFHHEDPIDGDLWAMIVGRNTAGLTVTCTTEAGALIEPEFRAAPHDTDGTLVRLIEQGYAPEPVPIPDGSLTFSSAEAFSIGINNATKNWDGVLEYSTNTSTWREWDGTMAVESAKHGTEQRIYLRGSGNSKITGDDYANMEFVLTGDNIQCAGNIETLLDYATVADGVHPTMANYCFCELFKGCAGLVSAPELPATALTLGCYDKMFSGCTSLATAPELPATVMAEACYYYMFANCTSLTCPPALPATALANSCYYGMFNSCKNLAALPLLPATNMKQECYREMFFYCDNIKVSETQTGEYQTPYRIPASGNSSYVDGGTTRRALHRMFVFTGGTFGKDYLTDLDGTPEVNKTYYTSNAVV